MAGTIVHVAVAWVVLALLPAAHDSFECVKAVGLRVLGVAALVLALPRPTRRLRGIDAAMAAWVAVEFAAAAFSVSPTRSMMGSLTRHDGLLSSLGLIGLYLAVRIGTGTPGAARSLLTTVRIALLLACAYAILQAIGLDPLPWDDRFAYATNAGTVQRAFGPVGNPSILAALAGTAAVLEVGAFAAGGPPIVAALSVPVATIALALTFSRTGFVALAMGLLMTWLQHSHDMGRGRLVGVTLAVFVIFALLVGLSPLSRDVLIARGAEIASGAPPGLQRVEIWRTIVRGWSARPVLGYGPDTVGLVFERFQRPQFWQWEWTKLPEHAHSAVLDVLFTRGLTGIAALCALATAVVVRLRRKASEGCEPWDTRAGPAALAAALSAAAVFSVLGLAGATLLCVALGLLAGPVSSFVQVATPDRLLWRRLVPAGAIAVALLVVGVSECRGQRFLWIAEASYERGADAAAAVAATDATRAIPWSADPQRMLAIASLAPGPNACERAEWAVDAAGAAVAREPLQAANALCLGRALATRFACGDSAAAAPAAAALARADALAPANALVLAECARTALAIGRHEEAARLGSEIVRLYPGSAAGYAIRGAALLAAGDERGAATQLELARTRDWHGDSATRDEALLTLARLRRP